MPRRAALSVVLAAACSTTTSTPLFETTPGITPLSVTVVPDPPAGADGVARNAALRIVFDAFPPAFPDPDTAHFGPIVLRSGRINFDIDVRVELVGRPEDDYRPAIVVVPRSELEANTHYELAISPAVRALDGRTVQQIPACPAVGGTATCPIDVGATVAPAPTPPPRLFWQNDVSERIVEGTVQHDDISTRLFQPPHNSLSCADPDCHSRKSSNGLHHDPARRLDFTRPPDDPIYGIIGVYSQGLAGTPEQLARVAPGDSARSLLLRKLLTADPDRTLGELRVPGHRMPISSCDEYPGLVNLVGQKVCPPRMPPDPLPAETLRDVQRWIDDGAPLRWTRLDSETAGR
jgi:hypothetical protein